MPWTAISFVRDRLSAQLAPVRVMARVEASALSRAASNGVPLLASKEWPRRWADNGKLFYLSVSQKWQEQLLESSGGG